MQSILHVSSDLTCITVLQVKSFLKTVTIINFYAIVTLRTGHMFLSSGAEASIRVLGVNWNLTYPTTPLFLVD